MDTPEGIEITGPMLARREERMADLAAGGTLDFLEETRSIREDDSWRVAEPAPGLVDHEDVNPPLWENVVAVS